ncbi:tcdB toxin N-terminal helical domain protein, partial [Escherichia coli 96.0427]
MIINELL